MAGKYDKVKDADRTSILVPNFKYCLNCGSTQRICLHEVFYGSSNRAKSKEDGMVVPLCFECHQGVRGIHNNKEMDTNYKIRAQKV